MQGRLRHSNSFKVKINPNADEYKANLCTVSRLLRPSFPPFFFNSAYLWPNGTKKKKEWKKPKEKFPTRGPFSVSILNIKLRK